jgi:ribosomal protein L16 Arg81 hydroxylase
MTTPVLSNRIFAKISELDPAVDFANSDEFVFVQNGSTLKINGQQIANSVTTINNLASKGYVDTLITNIIDSAPVQLNTLHELSAALNNDENFASTITTLIGTKLSSSDFASTFDTNLESKTTDDLAEGGNLYFTNERVLAVIDNPVLTVSTAIGEETDRAMAAEDELRSSLTTAIGEETDRAMAAEDELRSSLTTLALSLGGQIETVNVDGGEF